jgi:hypothetical protein
VAAGERYFGTASEEDIVKMLTGVSLLPSEQDALAAIPDPSAQRLVAR